MPKERELFPRIDYSTMETTVLLGSDFEPGVEYTVVVNLDTSEEFVAQ